MGKACYTGVSNPGIAIHLPNTSISFKQQGQQSRIHHWGGPGSTSRATKTMKTKRSLSLNSGMSTWTQQQKTTGNTTTHNATAHPYDSTGKAGEFCLEKISTNLKNHLLDHTAGKVAKEYWSGKTCFRDIDVNLVDWKMIEKVVKSQMISMRQWTAKFTTGFCTTGHRMVQMKKGKQLIAPDADIPTKTPNTSYNVPTQNPKHYGTPL